MDSHKGHSHPGHRHRGHRLATRLLAALAAGGVVLAAAPAGAAGPPADPVAGRCVRGEGNSGRITGMTAVEDGLLVSGWVRYCRPYRLPDAHTLTAVLATVGAHVDSREPTSWGSQYSYPAHRVRRHFRDLHVVAAPGVHHTCLYAATSPLDCWSTPAADPDDLSPTPTPRVEGPSPARLPLARDHGNERPNCGTCW
ncbi:hypothetical protein [Pilimelia terevasa]|nr:hypothetical protein [Pilimelia terevasa]